MHEPLEACSVAWVVVLQRISFELYTELKKADFWRPEVLDAINDLDADGLLGHLEEVLARKVIEEEVDFFSRMVQEAERFANTLRRRTLSNLTHPELVAPVLPKAAVLTGCDLSQEAFSFACAFIPFPDREFLISVQFEILCSQRIAVNILGQSRTWRRSVLSFLCHIESDVFV